RADDVDQVVGRRMLEAEAPRVDAERADELRPAVDAGERLEDRSGAAVDERAIGGAGGERAGALRDALVGGVPAGLDRLRLALLDPEPGEVEGGAPALPALHRLAFGPLVHPLVEERPRGLVRGAEAVEPLVAELVD